MIASMFLLLTTFAADPPAPTPPPLTAEQLTQVRALVQRTQADQAAAKKALTEAQESLSRCYAEYELNEEQVAKLQTEILDLQRKLLATHHRMQKDLRSIVGAERFQVLSRRIENALRNLAPPAAVPTVNPK